MSLAFMSCAQVGVSCCQQREFSFREALHRDKAFYNHPDYLKKTREDLTLQVRLPVSYTWNTENKLIRIAKEILSIIIFPIGIYQLFHGLAGIALLPASHPTSKMMKLPPNYANHCRSLILIDSQWKYRRLTIAVDGYEIDALMMGKPETLGNGRWVLASNGNGTFYEEASRSYEFKHILSELKGNAIFFNYPAVGASSGRYPNRKGMEKAYRAILKLLEDKKMGIGAKEIIGFGHSIGGGAQGDALNTHPLKEDVRHVFVKGRTFSDLSSAASALVGKISILKIGKVLGHLIGKIAGLFVKLLGWNIDSVRSSKSLKAPEIVL